MKATHTQQHVSREITKNLSAVTSRGRHSKLTHKFSLVDIFMLFITKLFISPGELIVLLQTPTEEFHLACSHVHTHRERERELKEQLKHSYICLILG